MKVEFKKLNITEQTWHLTLVQSNDFEGLVNVFIFHSIKGLLMSLFSSLPIDTMLAQSHSSANTCSVI